MRYLYLLSLLLLIGCRQQPSELQNLKPVTITVVNDGSPVDGVLVSLTNKDPQGAQSNSAVTDSNGTAVVATTIRTQIAKGAAPGTYIVSFDKTPELPSELIPTEAESELPENVQMDKQRKREDFVEKNRVIPKVLESYRTSPIELSVDKKIGAQLTVDLAKYKMASP